MSTEVETKAPLLSNNDDSSSDHNNIDTVVTGTATTTGSINNNLPKVIRDIKWDDPLYKHQNHTIDCEGEDTGNVVVAAFDVNRTIYDHAWYEPFAFLVIGILFLAWGLLFFVIVLVAYVICIAVERHHNKYRIQRQHIALTTSHICIDLVETPGSCSMMLRSKIALKDVSKVQILSEVRFWFNDMVHTVEVTKKDNTKLLIKGIRYPQSFSDAVIAMINHNNRTAGSATSSISNDIPTTTTTVQQIQTNDPLTSTGVEELIVVPYATAVAEKNGNQCYTRNTRSSK